MTNGPEFTQIPLNNQRLIALNDLKAVSGYNRNLIVPDDLPPVLSLPQIQAPLQPHLVTGQEDGSVNVHITGGSSGGGPAPITIDTHGIDSVDAQNYFSFEFDGGASAWTDKILNLRYLTGMHVTSTLSGTTTTDPTPLEWYIYAMSERALPNKTNCIALWAHAWSNFSNANTYATPNDSSVLTYTPPIDLYSSLGVSDGFYFYYSAPTDDSGYFTHAFFGYH